MSPSAKDGDPSSRPPELADRIRAGDLRAVARLLRLVDDARPAGLQALRSLYAGSPPGKIVGVTGSPGAGKSTLIDRVVAAYRALDEKVGVVAVDPTSPLTGGAILGDRVRMQRHALDPNVFVRSLASRGQLGGLSLSAASTVAVFEASGFSRIIVETVGIGQAEVDIAAVADTTVVVLAPGFGDDVQALKAGLLEVADVFAVNKSDRPGASDIVRDIEHVLRLRGPVDGWMPSVVQTSAEQGTGIDDLTAAVREHRAHLESQGGLQARRQARARIEIETRLMAQLRAELMARVGEGALDDAASAVASRALHATQAVDDLLG